MSEGISQQLEIAKAGLQIAAVPIIKHFTENPSLVVGQLCCSAGKNHSITSDHHYQDKKRQIKGNGYDLKIFRTVILKGFEKDVQDVVWIDAESGNPNIASVTRSVKATEKKTVIFEKPEKLTGQDALETIMTFTAFLKEYNESH